MKLLFNVDTKDLELTSLIDELRPAALLLNEKREPTADVKRKRISAYRAFLAELLLNHLETLNFFMYMITRRTCDHVNERRNSVPQR